VTSAIHNADRKEDLMPPASRPPIIIAVTGEDDRYGAVRSRAAALAEDGEGTVILYDIDAGGLFASPVPTAWSGDGEAELAADEAAPGDRLDPDALETAGRNPVADQVRALRAAGVDAWGWLPTSKDAADLAAYAQRQGATVVLVPPDLLQAGIVDRLVGRTGAAEADARSAVPFETVG
jgi:hypothetical protein